MTSLTRQSLAFVGCLSMGLGIKRLQQAEFFCLQFNSTFTGGVGRQARKCY